MPRRTKEDALKTRARILSSALALFIRNGYERTTFTDIAARLKLTKGAVYWHFKTKEALLSALVGEMHRRFAAHVSAALQGEAPTFRSIAGLMTGIAERVTENTKSRAFFLFMRTQVRWGEASMRSLRDRLLRSEDGCPYRMLVQAVRNDRAAGRVRADVDSAQTASVCMAVWDGLVQAKIDGVLECDMTAAISQGFDAIWASIKK